MRWSLAKVIRSGLPFASQALISISNLVIGLVLARTVSPREYGLYVLGFSIAMIVVGVQESLVSTPVTVRLATATPVRKVRLLAQTRHALTSVSLLLFGAAAVWDLALWATSTGESIRFFGTCSVVAALGWGAWDFRRTESFALGSTRRLARIDMTYVVLVLGGFGLLLLAGQISARAVLLDVGVAGILAAAVSGGRQPFQAARLPRLKRMMGCWWQTGRWSFGASQITWIQSQGYIYLVSGMLSIAALAAVSAARMLFAPLATLFAAWAKSSLPQLARLFGERDRSGFWRAMGVGLVLFLAINCLWGISLFAARGFVAETVFLGKYPDIMELAGWWLFAMTMTHLRSVAAIGLRSTGGFTQLTRIAFVGAGLTCALAPPMIAWKAGVGAVAALGIVEMLAAVQCLFALVARTRHMGNSTQ